MNRKHQFNSDSSLANGLRTVKVLINMIDPFVWYL